MSKMTTERHTGDFWKSHTPALVLLILATLATFSASLGHEFVTEWDDRLYVTRNLAAWGLSREHIYLAFTNYFVGNYAPLQIVSYMVDTSLWGLRPAGFIATNLLLHLANGLLYYLLVWRLTARRGWSFAAAAIFLLHPVQVESAVWISQRKNVLAMCFFLVSCHSYIVCKNFSGNKRILWYTGSIAAFICALLTKSVVVILPLVLMAYDICFLERSARGRWLLDKLPYFICSAVVGFVAIKSQSPELGGGLATEWHGGSPLATFYSMLTVMVHYMRLLIWPTGLSAYYEYPLKTSVDLEVAVAAVLLLVLGGAAVALWRHNRKMFFWAALTVVGILPVAQIIPLVTIMNDRYLYFPMLGVAALTTGLLDGWCAVPMRRKIIIPVMAIVLPALMILSADRSRVWQNSYTLWADAHEKFPRSAMPCFGLGSIHLQNGELEKARDYFLQAARLGRKQHS